LSREAALDLSPGRQPWVNVCHNEPALKGRQNSVLSPLQDSRSGELQTQGLRPGLMSNAASRLWVETANERHYAALSTL